MVIVSGDRRFVEHLLRDLAVALKLTAHAKPRNRTDHVHVKLNTIDLFLNASVEMMKQWYVHRYAKSETGIC